MKGTLIFKIFMVIALFFLSSCKEYFITTKINSDGTVERSISQKNDDSRDTGIPESWRNNPGWEIKTAIDTSDKKNNRVTGTKIFASFEEVNGETAKPQHGFAPHLDMKVEKHFRFFYTYFNYNETYKAYNVYKKIPIDKFFSAGELMKIKEAKDSAWVKQKFELYENVISYDRYLDVIQDALVKNDGIDLAQLLPKEKRMEMFIELGSSAKGKEDKYHSIVSRYLTEKIARKLEYIFSGNDKNLAKKFTAIHDSLSEYDAPYANAVIMPGIITSSNSKIIEGNKVSWKFDQYNFKFFDYEMNAESREVNTWVIVVSGIVILLIILGLFLPRIRKRIAF